MAGGADEADAVAGGWAGSLHLLRILVEGQAPALWHIPLQLKQHTMGGKRTNIYECVPLL